MKQDRYTLTYRAAEVRQVMNWIGAGESGCLLGLRGAGKSNFLRFILRQEVRARYLGPAEADFTIIYVDLLALAQPAEWAVYELLLDRLLGQLRLLGPARESIEEITKLYQEVIRAKDALIGQRAIERCLALICQKSGRIVLLLDEFEAIFGHLDPALFRFLRAIRDTRKERLSYIVVATEELAELRDDLAGIDHFYRLVSRNVCGLGPYNEADARQMLRYLAGRRSLPLSEQGETRLIELSGGHASLLKSLLSLCRDANQEGDPAKLAEALLEKAAIRERCQRVWASLSASTQAALLTLAAGGQIEQQVNERLKRRGLIRASQAKMELFSPIFAGFVRQQAPAVAEHILISRSPRRVQLEERRIEDLTGLEFELLCYLYERQGRVCATDEIIENVYRKQHAQMTGGVSDEALQQLISRLRAKIEPDRSQPRYILTVRGEGYKFVMTTKGD